MRSALGQGAAPVCAPASRAGRSSSWTAAANILRCSSGRRRRSARKPGVRTYFNRPSRGQPAAHPWSRTPFRLARGHADAARPVWGRAASGLAGGSGDGVDAVGGAGGVDFAGGSSGDADAGDNTAVKGYGQTAGKDAEALDINRSRVGLRVVLDRGGGHLEAGGGDGPAEAHLHRGACGGVGALLGDDDAVTVDNSDRDGVALRQG